MMPRLTYLRRHEEEKSMIHTVLKIRKHVGCCSVATALALLLLVCAGYYPAEAATKEVQQKTYGSPEEAVKAFIDAARSNDTKQMRLVLGPRGKDLISSGDEVADEEIRKRLIAKYDVKNRIEMVSDSRAVLSVGEDDWPLAIPIVKKGQRWLFDSKGGREEALNRRIGRNELAVIKVCEAYVDAQQEFALMDGDGDGLFEYAQSFVSAPGKKDGLYWETKEGERPSPLGPFAARARRVGYMKQLSTERPQPYYGYFYKILKGQGKSAKGGAYDYVVKGNMIGGFALVAYPARYGNSGVMTFIVNHEGVVYQKDLGKKTAQLAPAMTRFDPDKTWKKVEEKTVSAR
jgi:hypothetical protein